MENGHWFVLFKKAGGCFKYLGITFVSKILKILRNYLCLKILSSGAKGQHSQEMNKIEAPSLTFKWLLASFDVFHLLKIFYWEPQILVQQKYPAVDGRWAPSAAPHGDSAWFFLLFTFPALLPQPLTHLKRSRQGFSIFLGNMLNDLHGFSIFVLGDQPSRRLGHTPGVQKKYHQYF